MRKGAKLSGNDYLVHLNNLNSTLCALDGLVSGLHPEIVNILGEDGYKLHHSASAPDYMSRLCPARLEPYEGRFGSGIAVHIPSWRTNRYHNIEYYIKEETL